MKATSALARQTGTSYSENEGRERGAAGAARVAAGMGRFEQLNYLDEQVGVEDA